MVRLFDSISANPEPNPIQIQGFDDQKRKEKIHMKNFVIKNCNLLMFKLQEKTLALKREHSTTKIMKFINLFLCLWVIFALLDLDPDCESGFGYGFRDPVESVSGSTALRRVPRVLLFFI
jgi:hypothetical protein